MKTIDITKLSDLHLIKHLVQISVDFGMDVGDVTVHYILTVKKELLKRLNGNIHK